MIRVFIADDHDIVRTGLTRLLAEIPEMNVCGEAASATELLEKLENARPDVVVLDVNMPGHTGPKLVKQLLSYPCAPKVVMFSMYEEDSHAVAFLRAGASSYLSKKRSSKELIEAIRKVFQGERYLSEMLEKMLFDRGIDIEKSLVDELTQRELQVVRNLTEGLRSVDIAEKMGLSASTVNTYVQRIKDKLGFKSLLEIIRFAKENDLSDS